MTASYTKLIPSIAVLASLVLALPTFAQADNAAPVAPATQPGIVDPSIGVPETSGESQSEELATTSVDPSTGIAQTSIQFKAPKARGAAQPGVSLAYSSESGVGYAGWGWSLTIPSIVRRPLSGPPNFDSPPTTPTTSWVPKDQMFFDGQRLVPVCLIEEGGCAAATLSADQFPVSPGWWYFRESEDSSFNRFFLSPDQQTWVIQSKSGVTMELGKPLLTGTNVPAASVPAAIETTYPPPPNNIPYRWSLVRKYDAHAGNNVVYYIWSEGNAIRGLLTDIFYTPSVSATGTFSFANFAHHIAFHWGEPANANNILSGAQPPIWRAIPGAILEGVDITSARFNDFPGQREMVRRYHLTYNQTRVRSFLATVTLEGQCASDATNPILEGSSMLLPATSCPTRPPTTFTYQDVAINSDNPADWLAQPLTGNVPANSYLVDINSDGLPDWAQPGTSSGTNGTVMINALSGNAAVIVGAAQTLSIDVPAAGVTEQNFFPSPTATTFNFTMGSFVGNGQSNAGWFSAAPSNTSATYPFTSYSPAPYGSGWQWQKQFTNSLVLSPSDNWYSQNQSQYACDPAAILTTAYAVSPEAPYGSADVDGDGYPDLLTYQEFLSCNFPCEETSTGTGCAGSAPVISSLNVGIGLYTTVKNENGSLSPFAMHHGTETVPVVGGPTYSYMEFLSIPVSAASSTPRIIPEDLNGDGLTDVIAVTTAGIAAAYGMGNGTISAITTILTPGLSITDPSQVYIHDVNGDGLADILVVPTTGGIQFYANQNGEQFAFIADLPTVLPGLTGANTSLSFGDMNGSGVDDVIVVQKGASGNNAYYVDLFEGLRPGLLSTVTNGLGGTTALTYENTLQLDVAARTAGTPWARHVPQLLHHVTKIVTTNGLPGVYAQTLETDYAYTNPVYDGRDQRFVGFQQVQKHAIGDTENDQSGSVRTTYLTGICLYDNSSGTPCPAAAADRPFLSLTGAPVLVETFDDFGNYLSTVHTTYQVKEIETGTDGTFVRYALPTAVDTYLYDTASPSSTIVAETAINAVFPDSNEPVGQIQGALNLHGPSTHLQKNKTYDLYGNVLTAQDVGIVGTDQTITTTTTWQLAPGDPTFWLWTKHTEITTPFTSVGAFSDPGRSTTYTYSAQGDLKTVQVALSGTRALNRHDTASRQTAPTPTDASSGPLVEVKNQVYDQYGNATQSLGPNGVSCEQITYDPQFAQLPITDVIYTASPSTCSGAGITTSRAYQRGFEAQALQTDPGGPFTATTYDGFGRPLTVTKSSSTNVTQYSPKAAVIMAYADTPNESVYVQTWDGTTYRNKWVYSDGLGNSILTLTEAAGTDPGTWIASGIQKRGARGHVTDVYLPYFLSSITPASLSLAAVQPTSTPQHTIYDGFARPLFSTGYDGNANSQTYYHAVSTDAYDALHLQSGSNPLPTTTQKDGHGRVVLTTVRGRIGSSPTVTTVQTARSYTATGNLTTLSRSSGGSTVTQSMAYDSLGRMVENQEPNTTSGTNDWRYAYNDSGELVGTSDPRGCGVNIAYDAAGREISEDYSECEPNHVNYTPPQLTGAGSEALYVYDAPLGSTATSPDGRRYATISRGELTTFTYDPRGRLYTVTRTLPKPGTPADDWHARFSDSSFSYAINYDDADRVTTQGTGATALAVSGASSVTTSYDERGNIGSVTSSYGSLVTSTQFDFDGQMLEYQYGDHAQTYAKRSYDSLRRLSTSNVARSPAWVQPGNGYTLPSDDSTLEQILEAKTIGYDLIGNPLTITDPSGTTKWPTGAARMTRTATYDDFYHVVTVTDNTGGDTYVQPYGPEFASGTDSPVPATIVTPRVSSQTFNYDWLGNTTQSTDDQQIFYDRSLGTISNDPVYANRITGAVGSTASDNLSVSYDAQGDVTNVNVSRSKPLTSSCISNSFVYQWDELGRMSRATRTDLVKTSPLHVSVTPADITYAYDASGQRVLKTVSNDQQLTTLYTAEIFPTLRLNGATWNSSTSQYEDDVTTESVYLAGAGGVLARVAYSTTDPQVTTTGSLDNLHVLFELTDALGSTSFVIDRGTSELVEAATYQPYGALDSDLRTSRWGNFREQYKFTGKEDDIEVGLTYFGGRYYAPNLGRWMSADPMAVHKLQADLNTYAYVSGRVFRVTDPTGFDGEDSEDSSYSFGANTSSSGFFDNLWNVGDTLGQAADAVSQFASDFADSILPGALSGATAGASSLMGLGPGQSPGDQAGFQFGAVIGTGAQMVATDGASEFVTVGAEVAGDVGAAAGQMFARGAPAAQIADLGDVAANAVTPAATPAAATGATATEEIAPVVRNTADIPATFIGQESGPSIVVPQGASGPIPTNNGLGVQYTGGAGGPGLSPSVSGVRIMEPTAPAGPSPGYPNGYASYSNARGQAINPLNGQTVPKSSPWWHIDLGGN